MYSEFELIFTILIFSSVVLGLTMTLTRFLRPSNPTEEKRKVYECGEDSEGVAAHLLHSRFYRIAIVFLVFDVEVIFVYPIAVLFKKMVAINMGATVFFELLAFVFVLGLGFVYAWKKGGLCWETDQKTFFIENKNG